MRTPPVEPGAVLSLIPETLVAGGDALARVEGFPVFISGAFPGDEVRVRISEVKKGFARGVVDELETAGPLRRAAPCPVAEECGGCDWTALRLDAQLEAKRGILVDTLRRIGKIDAADLPPLRIHPSPLNYRLRSRLQYDEESGAVGFFAARSHRVVPLPAECEVVGTRTIEQLDRVKDYARTQQSPVAIFEVADSIVVETADGEGRLDELVVADERYAVHTDGFFQVNRHLLSRLLDLVRGHAASAANKRLAFDLYAGVGFFALPLSRIFDSVVLVESARPGLLAARKNAEGRSNVKVVRRDVGDFLERSDDAPDFIMIDPPRAGITPEVLDHIARFREAKICYLSCDPVTFSRDVSRLRRHGWRLTTLDLIDLFPNTHHIETLSRLEFAR